MRSLIVLLLAAWAGLTLARAPERIVGLPCEGCESVFDGIPSHPGPRARIGRPDEPGRAMQVTGRVFDGKGRPGAGVLVYAYQTNAAGIYPTSPENAGRPAHRHGLLRAWVRTDSEGRYTFDTIRPARYPGTALPEHIHMHVIEPGRCTYYIDDIMFADDSALTPAKIRQLTLGRGGSGIARPQLRGGTWHVSRDIVLGKNIPGYGECGR